jgi:hypothetical protein
VATSLHCCTVLLIVNANLHHNLGGMSRRPFSVPVNGKLGAGSRGAVSFQPI